MSSGVQFDEDSFARPRTGGPNTIGTGVPYRGGPDTTGEPGMIRWLMKHGIVKSHAGGQAVMVGIIILNLAIIFFILKSVA